MKRLLFILFVLCTALWARPNVYIDAVEVTGVHEDYAHKIVQWTKDAMAAEGKVSFVNGVSQSEYVLRISLVKEEYGYGGVIVTFKLLDSGDGTILWSYSAMAYTPKDFAFAISEFNRKFGKWNGFKLGVGIGAIGVPIEGFHAAPALDLNAHYMFDNQFVTLDLNAALWLPLLNYGAFLSYAYVFNTGAMFPYVGGGAGASLTEYDPDGSTMINTDVSLLVKTGLILKPRGYSTFYAFELRLTYNLLKSLYVEDSGGHDVTDEHSPSAFGLMTTFQVWW